jgi:pterin-4a-carbinolamine dehydratase
VGGLQVGHAPGPGRGQPQPRQPPVVVAAPAADEAERLGPVGIWRTYQFDDFASATLFVGRVADATAAGGHQPDIAIRGGRVTLELAPRAGSALTADDLMVAARIQRLVGDHHPPIGRSGPWSPSGRLAGIKQRPVGPAGP